jgi:type IV pilus assembly protein PilY1
VINTGRLLYNDDVNSTQTQSAYGIWEKLGADAPSANLQSPNPTRSDLVAQSILAREEVLQVSPQNETRSFFTVSSNQVDWSSKQGWFFDLIFPDSASSNTTYSYPKALYRPVPFLDSVVISAVVPASGLPSCDNGKGRGYGLLLDALTGGASLASMDTDGNGVIDENDGEQSGYTFEAGPQEVLTDGGDAVGGGGNTPTKRDCIKGSIQSSEGDELIQRCPEFRNIKDRIWRQLLNPPAP